MSVMSVFCMGDPTVSPGTYAWAKCGRFWTTPLPPLLCLIQASSLHKHIVDVYIFWMLVSFSWVVPSTVSEIVRSRRASKLRPCYYALGLINFV